MTEAQKEAIVVMATLDGFSEDEIQEIVEVAEKFEEDLL